MVELLDLLFACWILGGLLGWPCVAILWRKLNKVDTANAGQCAACGYPLPSPGATCPECGRDSAATLPPHPRRMMLALCITALFFVTLTLYFTFAAPRVAVHGQLDPTAATSLSRFGVNLMHALFPCLGLLFTFFASRARPQILIPVLSAQVLSMLLVAVCLLEAEAARPNTGGSDDFVGIAITIMSATLPLGCSIPLLGWLIFHRWDKSALALQGRQRQSGHKL